MPKIKPGKKKFEKILLHPDRLLIGRMLKQGDSVRFIEETLAEKYPGDFSKKISYMTLQAYRKEFLNIDKEAIAQLKKEEEEKITKKEEASIDRQMKNLPTYKEALAEAKDEHVNIRQTLKSLEVLINRRTEYLFDLAQQGKVTAKQEENLLGYMGKMLEVLEKWGKYVEKIADKTIQTDVNITVVQDQAFLIREAILETLDEVIPDLKIKFLENLNKKLDNTIYRKDNTSIKNISTSTNKMLEEYVEVEISDD